MMKKTTRLYFICDEHSFGVFKNLYDKDIFDNIIHDIRDIIVQELVVPTFVEVTSADKLTPIVIETIRSNDKSTYTSLPQNDETLYGLYAKDIHENKIASIELKYDADCGRKWVQKNIDEKDIANSIDRKILQSGKYLGVQDSNALDIIVDGDDEILKTEFDLDKDEINYLKDLSINGSPFNQNVFVWLSSFEDENGDESFEVSSIFTKPDLLNYITYEFLAQDAYMKNGEDFKLYVFKTAYEF